MQATKVSRLVLIALVLMAIGFALTQILMGQSSRSLPGAGNCGRRDVDSGRGICSLDLFR